MIMFIALLFIEKVKIEISYDVLGRRIEKKFNNGSYRRYYYSNQDIILEENYDKKQKLKNKKYFTYGNTVDDILSVEIIKYSKKGEAKKPKRYFYHKDNLGSIIAISNEKAKIIEEYAYDVFGKPYSKKKSGKIIKLKKSKIGNTRMYTGREYDRGLKLYYNRARYYNPKLGRFISRDPIDIADDVNLYSYVGNNSIMYIDPSGEVKKLTLDIINVLDWVNTGIFVTAIPFMATPGAPVALTVMGGTAITGVVLGISEGLIEGDLTKVGINVGLAVLTRGLGNKIKQVANLPKINYNYAIQKYTSSIGFIKTKIGNIYMTTEAIGLFIVGKTIGTLFNN